jgi:hypothetical protein
MCQERDTTLHVTVDPCASFCIDGMVQVQVPPRPPALTLIIDGGDGARRPVFEPASQTPAGPLPRPPEQPLPKISLDPVRQQQTDRDSTDGFARRVPVLPGAAGPHGVRQARHVPPVRRLALNAKRSCRARREVCDLCLQCVCSLFVFCVQQQTATLFSS